MKPNLVPTARPSKDLSRDSNPTEPWWLTLGGFMKKPVSLLK
jgi:hypothetical protein